MYDDLKLFVLVPVFGAAGAAATALTWQVFDVTLAVLTPPAYGVLACLMCGLIGPLAVGAVVWATTRQTTKLRWPAGVGLGLVLATELAFYVPLGFMAVAFYQA